MKNNTKNSARKPTTAVLFAVMIIVSVLVVMPVSAGEIIVESPHPLPDEYDHTWTIVEPGVAQMRIHFSRIDTDPYGTTMYLYDQNDNLVVQYGELGTAEDVWSRWVCGDTIKVRLKCEKPWGKPKLYEYFGLILDDLETRDYIPTMPIASFTYFPKDDLFVDEPIVFTAYPFSYDPDGNILGITSYEWDFGDGTTGTGSRLTHSYSSKGSYIVSLTVTDDDGETNSASKVVNSVGIAKNIARNPMKTGYPHPLESDSGWGGGARPWDIVNGVSQEPVWYRGLAFTGGVGSYMNKPCGWRQATINFGEERTFNRVRIWYHGVSNTPRVYKIQYWGGTDWIDVFSTTSNTQGRVSEIISGIGNHLVEDSFSSVTASKVRVFLNNCDLCLGWIYEFEVYDPNFRLEAPVANAGIDQTVEQTYYQGADVVLDGSGSYDPDGDPLTYTWTWDDGSATGVNPTVSLPLGTTTIILIVNDGTVDSDPDTVVIMVQDTTSPEITCPADVTVEQETADGTVVPLTATATDICDADPTITSDELAIYPLGKTTVTSTATDDSGNSASCSTTVTVEDTTPPVITCQADVTVEQETADGTVVPLTATATDICDTEVEITSDAPAIFPLGTTTVTFTATDDSGNSVSDTVIVTVEDTTSPVLTCPEDVSVEQETADGTVVPLTATATDICDADPTITSDELAIYPLGTTKVTFTAKDDSGNSASCSMTVTVVDTTPPVITCPADVTVEQESAAGTVVPLTATATDICDADPTITSDELAIYPLGKRTVTFTATDNAGNSASCSTTVTVEDTTPPVITCPADVTVEQETADGTAVPLTATATDSCDASPTITSDELAIYPLGKTTVTFTATDNAGNSASCSMTVTVEDTTPPVITCPVDVTVEQESADGTVVPLTAMATDICDADPTITSDELAIYPLGKTTVTFTATDNAGNSASCSTTVTVEDTTPPVITCPADVTIEQETADGTVVPLTATATDICDASPTITSDAPAIFPLGTTTVTFMATDNAGNSASCSMTVTVEDTTLPEISVAVSPDTLWPANHKMVDITATVTATDICDAAPTVVLTSVTSNEPDDAKGNGDGKTVDDIQGADVSMEVYSFQLRAERDGKGDGRTYTITYMVTDASGNSASASATVVVPHDRE